MARPVTKTVGTITSILDPLTSRFTAPSHPCSNLLLTVAGTTSGKTLAERVANEQGAGKYTDCFPPYWYSHHHKPTNYAYAYSPAVCPHGYTTLGETVMTDGRTTASCCPSTMSTAPWTGGMCISLIASSTSIVKGFLAYPEPTASQTTINVGPNQVYKQERMIYPTWASSDLSLFVPKSAPLLPDSTSTPAGSKSTSSTGTTKANESQGSSALSTGDEAGIGIGVALGVILLLLGVFFLLRMRKRKQHSTIYKPYGYAPEQELKGNPVYEAQDGLGKTKSGYAPVRAELSGDWQGHEI